MTPPLPGWTFDVIHKQPDAVTVHATPPPSDSRCPRCGEPASRWGSTRRTTRDLPIDGKRTTILWAQPGYRCEPCGSRFRPLTPGISTDHPRLSQRLMDAIVERLRAGDTAEAVGADVKVSANTAWRVGRKAGVVVTGRGRYARR